MPPDGSPENNETWKYGQAYGWVLPQGGFGMKMTASKIPKPSAKRDQIANITRDESAPR
jgi:hypothetical protein